MNLQTSSSLANVCMAAQLRLAIRVPSRERERERETEINRREKGRLCALPRHATADPSMTAYLQRSQRERKRNTTWSVDARAG